MTPPLVGLVPFGLVCGVGAQAAGASAFEAFGMSALIISGAAQILAAQLMATDAPALEDHSTRVAALAAGIAVVALDALPMRLSLVCAGLIGIAAGMLAEARRGAR